MISPTASSKGKLIFGFFIIGWTLSVLVLNFYTGDRSILPIVAFIFIFTGVLTLVLNEIYDKLIPISFYGLFVRGYPGFIVGLCIAVMQAWDIGIPYTMTPLGVVYIATLVFIGALFILSARNNMLIRLRKKENAIALVKSS